MTWDSILHEHRWRKDRAAVVLLSGGLDSTACAHVVASIYPRDRVAALLVDYGQPHRDNELVSAEKTAKALGIRTHRLTIADAMHALRPAERLANAGHDPSAEGPHPATVPGRNAILLSLAAAHGCAWFEQQIDIWIGACLDDARFADCRTEFVQQATVAITYGCGRGVAIVAPWLQTTKKALVAAASSDSAVLASLRRSWSCYRGGSSPCGECTPCVLRAEAFAAIAQPDEQPAAILCGGDVARESRLRE